MTKDEFHKAVDDVIEDRLRNDSVFGDYAHKVTDAVWPVLEAAEKERDDVAQQLEQSEQGKRKISEECDAMRAKIARMDEAMESLLIRCDDSDSEMYGILSTGFVRDTVRIARGALVESK